MSADKPTVSVALCTCNGEKFLREQLHSILTQTRLPDEVVICDDRSEDSTPRIIESFATSSEIPIRSQINPVRLGVTKNFEKAISLASSNIIFLADQDDVWHANKIERILDIFADPAIAMVFCNGAVVDENALPLGYTLWDSVWFDSTEQRKIHGGDPLPVLLRHAIAPGTTLAFRSAFCPLLLPIPDLPHCHDIWITLVLACAAEIYPLNENLIDYRLHSRNAVGLKKHGLLSQIRMARWQLRFRAFQFAADLHQAALTRLQDDGSLTEPMEVQLMEKIRHSHTRHNMPRNPLARLPIILREWRHDRYDRYSYGIKSVLQDLFLRW